MEDTPPSPRRSRIPVKRAYGRPLLPQRGEHLSMRKYKYNLVIKSKGYLITSSMLNEEIEESGWWAKSGEEIRL